MFKGNFRAALYFFNIKQEIQYQYKCHHLCNLTNAYKEEVNVAATQVLTTLQLKRGRHIFQCINRIAS